MRSGQLFVTKPWIFVACTFLLMRVAKELDPFVARIVALTLITFWSWYFLQLGVVLHSKLIAKNERTLRRFRIGIGYVFLYMATIIWFPSNEFLLNNSYPVEFGWRWAIVPLGMIFFFSLLQTFYSLSLWLSECRKTQGLEEHWGVYMMLFWFFPIGIFIVQPRVRALLR